MEIIIICLRIQRERYVSTSSSLLDQTCTAHAVMQRAQKLNGAS